MCDSETQQLKITHHRIILHFIRTKHRRPLWCLCWIPTQISPLSRNFNQFLSSLWKTLTLESPQTSSATMWDLGDLRAGGHMRGSESVGKKLGSTTTAQRRDEASHIAHRNALSISYDINSNICTTHRSSLDKISTWIQATQKDSQELGISNSNELWINIIFI